MMILKNHPKDYLNIKFEPKLMALIGNGKHFFLLAFLICRDPVIQ